MTAIALERALAMKTYDALWLRLGERPLVSRTELTVAGRCEVSSTGV
jgi:hypothetical protein